MKIKINNNLYDCNTNAITTIRFRSFFGFSFVTEYAKKDSDMLSLLVRLLYISLGNPPPLSFSEFEKECILDDDFLNTALLVKEDIFEHKRSENQPITNRGGGEFDEFVILAQMGFCGLDTRLLYELKLMQICEIIRHWAEIKNPSSAALELLTGTALKLELGITPETEKEIENALERSGR